MSQRQVSQVLAQVEVKPGKYRQVSQVVAQAEVKPGKYRQVSQVMVQVELLIGHISRPEDALYAEWQGYIAKLRDINQIYEGIVPDDEVAYWENYTTTANFNTLKQRVVEATLAAIQAKTGLMIDIDEVQG